ncbi:MAG: tetratricopeptide repeat protein [Pseudomonadota bacterium]
MRRTVLGTVLAATALIWGIGTVAPVSAQTLTAQTEAPNGVAGPYLGAVSAELTGDIAAAARLYDRAATGDPDNIDLRRRALWQLVLAGEVDTARPHADYLLRQGVDDQAVGLIVIAEEIRAGAFPRTAERLVAGNGLLDPLLSGMIAGWALSVDDIDAAAATFEGIQGPDALRRVAVFHSVLARAVSGDMEGAATRLEALEGDDLFTDARSIIAIAEIWAATGRQGAALALLDEAESRGFPPGILQDVRSRIGSGTVPGLTVIENATEGAAEALYTMAQFLVLRRESRQFPLFLARLTLHLAPDHDEARLLLSGILSGTGQYALAMDVLSEIAPTSPQFIRAETNRAGALQNAGRAEEAIGVLTALSRAHPESLTASLALADALRREERWVEASDAYSAAIDLVETIERNSWVLFFRRGIAYERSDRWPAAEADFRRALELNPDEPNVLNYLGYSLVELGRNYEEAEQMIRTAVEREPQSGYIVDSLAWVLYRMGRFEEAVEPMERAVALVPFDPILNDHLGDILWMVGRKTEAQFQWKRALSFEPQEEEIPRIRRKLAVGLDTVLEEEAAEPSPQAATEEAE